jgi:asparagine synthetase B (glutamine-hydrolysing)
MKLRPYLAHRPAASPKAVESAIREMSRSVRPRGPDEVGVIEIPIRLSRFVEMADCSPHDLHVLLRHRPRSISPLRWQPRPPRPYSGNFERPRRPSAALLLVAFREVPKGF